MKNGAYFFSIILLLSFNSISGYGQYKRIYPESQTISEDYYLLPRKKKNQWGFVNHKNEFVISAVYDSVTHFFDGQAIVKKDGRYDLIAPDGTILKKNINPFSQQAYSINIQGRRKNTQVPYRVSDGGTIGRAHV